MLSDPEPIAVLRQPRAAAGFVQLRKDCPEPLRLVGDLADSNQIMASTLFLGIHPGLTAEMLQAEIGAIQAFAGGLRDS